MSGDGLAWALRYAAAGMLIFPVNAQRTPLTLHGFKDASSDPEVIKAWRGKWAHCDFGWAMPASIVVVDVDRKNGKDGFKDFKDRAGCDPHDVPTPQATTPSGGLHVIYEAAKAYRNSGGDRGGRPRYPQPWWLRRAVAARQWSRMAAPAYRRRRRHRAATAGTGVA